MGDWGKIAVGVRVGSQPDAHFFASWTRLLCNGLRTGDVVLPPSIHLPHSNAANRLVEGFLQTGCDSLLFVDDDMVFDAGTLERLRADDRGWGCDILSALYTTRRWPCNPIAFKWDEAAGKVAAVGPLTAPLVECDIVGLGFTLIRRHLLSLNVFRWDEKKGEDGLFCLSAKAGFGARVGVLSSVRVGHRVSAAAAWDPDAGSAVLDLAGLSGGSGSTQ